MNKYHTKTQSLSFNIGSPARKKHILNSEYKSNEKT